MNRYVAVFSFLLLLSFSTPNISSGAEPAANPTLPKASYITPGEVKEWQSQRQAVVMVKTLTHCLF